MAIDYGAQTEGIDKLANSLMAQTKERNKVLRNRKKRAQKYQALASIGGHIGNAVLRDRADKFVNNEFNLSNRLKINGVMQDISRDNAALEKLQKDPDYYFNQAKQEILENAGAAFDADGVGVDLDMIEAQISPVARRIAEERESLLAQRLKVAGNIETLSGGDPNFYETELRKLKPSTVGSWLTGLVTGNDDDDLEAIMAKYNPYLEAYEELKGVGVPKVSAANLSRLYPDGMPRNTKVELRDVKQVDRRTGEVSTVTRQVVINGADGSFIGYADNKGGNLGDSPLDPTAVAFVPKKDQVDEMAAVIYGSTGDDGREIYLKQFTDAGLGESNNANKAVTEAFTKNTLAPAVNLSYTLTRSRGLPKEFADQLAATSHIENEKWITDEDSDVGTSLIGNGATENPLLSWRALDTIKINNPRENSNPEMYKAYEKDLLIAITDKTILARLVSNMSKDKVSKLINYMDSKSMFDKVPETFRVLTGDPHPEDPNRDEEIAGTLAQKIATQAGVPYLPRKYGLLETIARKVEKYGGLPAVADEHPYRAGLGSYGVQSLPSARRAGDSESKPPAKKPSGNVRKLSKEESMIQKPLPVEEPKAPEDNEKYEIKDPDIIKALIKNAQELNETGANRYPPELHIQFVTERLKERGINPATIKLAELKELMREAGFMTIKQGN